VQLCIRFGLSVVFAVLLGGCEGESSTGPAATLGVANGPNGKNAVVRITPESDTLDALGEAVQLTTNAVGPAWVSLTPTVVTVDASGNVVAVGTGLGLVQAVVGRKADTAEVFVRQIPVALSVSPDTLEFIFSPEPQTLTAVVEDANGFAIPDQPITWSSDDSSVATVVEGVVTATLGAGATWVRAFVGVLTDSAFVNTPATPFP
jgi:hypothetical protein